MQRERARVYIYIYIEKNVKLSIKKYLNCKSLVIYLTATRRICNPLVLCTKNIMTIIIVLVRYFI